MPSNRFMICIVLLVAIILAACTAGPAVPAATTAPANSPAQATATLPPTPPPAPTQTLQPSLTPPATSTPTADATLPPTATMLPTPDPALAKIKLIGLAWLPNYDLLLSFQFPGPVDPKMYRVTLEDKEYSCEVLAKYPDRLYCHGQGAKVLATAAIRVYQAGSDQPGFEKDVWVPYFQ